MIALLGVEWRRVLARRLVRVGWALEPGGLGGWRVSAEPSPGAG